MNHLAMMLALAIDMSGTTPEAFTAFIRQQIDVRTPVVRQAHIRAD